MPLRAPLAVAFLLAVFAAAPASAQQQSGRVVSDAEFTSAYDAFMKINRFTEAPSGDENADEYYGGLLTRLANQAGRNLIKRPEPGLSEDAFHGWLSFVASYGNNTRIGNCTACHTPAAMTDGQPRHIGTGEAVVTPSLRNLGDKNSFLRGKAETLEEAIKIHVENGRIARQNKREPVDPELGKIALTDEEIKQVAAFIRSLQDVERDDFREFLINVVIQPLELDF